MPHIGSRLSLVAIAIAVLADTAALRFLWRTTDLAQGEYLSGYFEEVEGNASLVFDGRMHGSVVPDIGVDTRGSLSLPPGRSIGLDLRDGAEYRILVEGHAWAPFLIFGKRHPLPDDAKHHGGLQLVDARRLQVGPSGLEARPWQILRPWKDDERDLRQLMNPCSANAASEVTVRIVSRIVEITFGTCRTQLNAAGPADLLAVLAGPAWTTVRKAGGWQRTTNTEIKWVLAILVVCLGKTALLLATAGPIATLALGLLTTTLLGLAPDGAVVLLPVSFLLALLALALRLATRHKLAMLSGFVALLLVALSLRALLGMSRPSPQSLEQEPSQCVLIGYSAIRGDGLRQDPDLGVWIEHGGMWDILSKSPTCPSLQRQARAAGMFSDMRDLLCHGSSPVAEGGTVIFFGGSNDDYLWGRAWDRGISPVLRMARYAYARPTAAQWDELRQAAETSSLSRVDEQIQALEEALRCSSHRHAQFLYVHDFAAWDLAAERSPARRRMMELRAEHSGTPFHRFIDLYESVHETAGVWWFNDYIHPSLLGHRRIGEVISSAIAHPR